MRVVVLLAGSGLERRGGLARRVGVLVDAVEEPLDDAEGNEAADVDVG